MAIISIFPLISAFGISITTEGEFTARLGRIILPSEPTFSAYRFFLASDSPVYRGLLVSTICTISGTALTLLLITIGGYVLSYKDLPGRTFLILMVVGTILMNGGMIPTYLVVRNFRMLNTLWALIIPGAVDSFGLLIMKQFFEKTPKDIIDAAIVDGASEFTLMWRICVPMAIPTLAALGLFNAVGRWNSWFDALIYINDPRLFPIQLVIRNLSQFFYGLWRSAGPTMRVSQEGMLMAAVICGILPILLVYPFLQKYFVKGVYMGAIKE